jgi:hypothetical protein
MLMGRFVVAVVVIVVVAWLIGVLIRGRTRR